jgi:hypothetical protein
MKSWMWLVVCLSVLLCCSGDARIRSQGSADLHPTLVGFRRIEIPKRRGHYDRFGSTIIRTQKEHEEFPDDYRTYLKVLFQGPVPRMYLEFVRSLSAAKIDFSREALVLLRHDEGSGSIRVALANPWVANGVLYCKVEMRAWHGKEVLSVAGR